MTNRPRYICIHGHFYQPPRENPWLETIERQDSAAPYHDWNERVNAECYGPNATARLLTEKGKIRRLLNNYAHVSYNVGPTLLSWLERADPRTYHRIIDGDRLSRESRDGHGNALAQAYNHIIMPLASERDRRTQLIWGMEDFRRRFGRDPEGLWLPEAAVDSQTLSMMAELGIRFTILSPEQARRVREKEGHWQDVSNGSIDPTRPYHVDLPSGRSMALFFYDASLSRAVAFERVLDNGEFFLGRMMDAFHSDRPWTQLVHAATDGESYGHHHRFGEMALAYLIEKVIERGQAKLTNYGQYLADHLPTAEVRIKERSSWSCAHGLGRWRRDCGCSSGARPDWNQKWRAPLRTALDNLKRRADTLFETDGKRCFNDPWRARDRYISLIHASRDNDIAAFLDEQGLALADPSSDPIDWTNGPPEGVVHPLALLEMARHAMLMYTSCAWFFDDVAGLEVIQNLRYAARVIGLAQDLGHDWEPAFLADLEKARGNEARLKNGRIVYERRVRPSVVSRARAVAHYAMARVLEPDDPTPEFFAFEALPLDHDLRDEGANALVVGRARTVCRSTRSAGLVAFAALHLGGREVQCGVIEDPTEDEWAAMRQDILGAFDAEALSDLVRRMDQHFAREGAGASRRWQFGLRDLFPEARRRALAAMSEEAVEETRSALSATYGRYRPLMKLFRDSQAPLPVPFLTMTRLMLDRDINEAMTAFVRRGNAKPLARAIDEAREWGVEVEIDRLSAPLRARLLEEFEAIVDGAPLDRLSAFCRKLRAAVSMGLNIPRWELQNRVYERFTAIRKELGAQAATGDEGGRRLKAWRDLLRQLDFDPSMSE